MSPDLDQALMYGTDKRERDVGRPDGLPNRRGERNPDDTLPGHLKWAGAAIVGLAAVVGAVVSLSQYIPETKAQATKAHVAIQVQIDDVKKHGAEQDRSIVEMRGRLDNIDKNQAHTLNLQLRAAKRSLCADISTMKPGVPGRANLERQLDEINADLGESGSCS